MTTSALQKIQSEVPENIYGIERVRIISHLLDKLDQSDAFVLRLEIEKVLSRMGELSASDIDMGGHGCNGQIWYRINGKKSPVDNGQLLSIDETDILLLSLLSVQQREMLFRDRNLDFSYQLKSNDFRFRADIYFDMEHIALNMRHIVSEIRPLQSLDFHKKVLDTLNLATMKQGLILVTGITGSGKSSTLDSIIDAHNQTVSAHIAIIASPIETVHPAGKCIIRHREVGCDVSSFKAGAVQSLRQDPDIIVIGEMRDPETIMTALEITDSGHKVFSTLHTGSAVESIDRIIGECPTVDQERVRIRLADVLKCVVSQKLVSTIDGKLELVKEVMLMTSSIRAAIRNGNTGEIYQMINEGCEEGMNTLEQDLVRAVRENKITPGTAENNANNRSRMQELL